MRFLIQLFVVTISCLSHGALAQKIQFKLYLVDGSYVGTMNPKWYEEIQLTLAEDHKNLANAKGIMTGERFGTMNFTVTKNKTGTDEDWMIKTNNGWYPLTKVKMTSEKLLMSFNWGFQAPNRNIDLEVLQRTKQLLGIRSSWNHEDDRRCDDDMSAKRWSLYCALKQAYLDLTGDFNHRAAGLNVVRESISEVNPEWKYKHQLMEFNNDETYDEVIDLLNLSIEKMNTLTKVN
ncbi:MAG: hypothetical protein ABJP45_16835 [Cyclobacteriaceae bacterium]